MIYIDANINTSFKRTVIHLFNILFCENTTRTQKNIEYIIYFFYIPFRHGYIFFFFLNLGYYCKLAYDSPETEKKTIYKILFSNTTF